MKKAGLDVTQSHPATVQDTFWQIPGLISCAGMTERWGLYVRLHLIHDSKRRDVFTFTIITHKHTRCSTHQAARTSYAWVIFFASLLRNWPTARKFKSLISTNMFSSEFKTRPRGPEGGGAPFGACCTSSENIWRGNLAASEGE